MTNAQIMALDKENVMHTYARFPVAIEKGSGATLTDFDGKEYIDFASGIGVNCLGYGNEKWINAVTAQASKLQHVSNLFYTEPGARLAKELKNRTGMSAVFFGNSGAEANEGIIKLARKYSYDKYGEGRSTIVTLENSFHGRTITTLNATGQDVFHKYFFPFTAGFKYAQANNFDSVKAAVTGDVCAVMMELIQGEGGVNPLEQDFVKKVMALCKEKDVLLLIDEVQTGIGRTGTLFAFQQYELLPDAVSFAKGIAGGLPMGGFMANEKTKNVLGFGTHASTFGANPVCSAAALSVLEQLDSSLLRDVISKGEYIRSKIESMGLPFVKGTRGLGLMIGAAIEGADVSKLAAKCIENGLLVLTAGRNTLRLLPPLTITYDEIDRGLKILEDLK